MNRDDVVARLGLEPLPEEGGMFRRSHGDAHSSAIYFLLDRDQPTLFHRLPGAEIFHFYMGAPARLHLLEADGEARQVTLGTDLDRGERPQFVVLGGVWQAAASEGEWTLLGTTMAPGFEWEDFELGTAEELRAGWPGAADLIDRHT